MNCNNSKLDATAKSYELNDTSIFSLNSVFFTFSSEPVLGVNELHKNGITTNNQCFSYRLSAIICDTRTKVFLKCTKGYNAYHGCYKREQHGVYNGKVTFLETIVTLRTDASLANISDCKLHICLSPLARTSIGLISQVPGDFMRLSCLDVLRKYVCSKLARKARAFSDFERWKATEFQQLLLHTATANSDHDLQQSIKSILISNNIIDKNDKLLNSVLEKGTTGLHHFKDDIAPRDFKNIEESINKLFTSSSSCTTNDNHNLQQSIKSILLSNKIIDENDKLLNSVLEKGTTGLNQFRDDITPRDFRKLEVSINKLFTSSSSSAANADHDLRRSIKSILVSNNIIDENDKLLNSVLEKGKTGLNYFKDDIAPRDFKNIEVSINKLFSSSSSCTTNADHDLRQSIKSILDSNNIIDENDKLLNSLLEKGTTGLNQFKDDITPRDFKKLEVSINKLFTSSSSSATNADHDLRQSIKSILVSNNVIDENDKLLNSVLEKGTTGLIHFKDDITPRDFKNIEVSINKLFTSSSSSATNADHDLRQSIKSILVSNNVIDENDKLLNSVLEKGTTGLIHFKDDITPRDFKNIEVSINKLFTSSSSCTTNADHDLRQSIKSILVSNNIIDENDKLLNSVLEKGTTGLNQFKDDITPRDFKKLEVSINKLFTSSSSSATNADHDLRQSIKSILVSNNVIDENDKLLNSVLEKGTTGLIHFKDDITPRDFKNIEVSINKLFTSSSSCTTNADHDLRQSIKSILVSNNIIDENDKLLNSVLEKGTTGLNQFKDDITPRDFKKLEVSINKLFTSSSSSTTNANHNLQQSIKSILLSYKIIDENNKLLNSVLEKGTTGLNQFKDDITPRVFKKLEVSINKLLASSSYGVD
ncbi:uncharacterized protein LOC136086084 [Hydra vulgaris]|uniref:Uncharacterized protein LOC136086084 n=1 Tax=Hydra vulgaris TaxID=6087 RepID=A0ABM4CRC1_HYDVU